MMHKNIRHTIAAVLCTAIPLTSCTDQLDRRNRFDEAAPVETQAPATIRGKVLLESETDHTGVVIALDGPSLKTVDSTADGSFALNQILPGDYTITIEERYFEPVTINISLPIGGVHDIATQTLAARRANASGTVAVQGDSQDASNVLVSAQRTSSLREVAAAPGFVPQQEALESGNAVVSLTDRDGNFTLADLPAGRYTFRAWREGLSEVSRTVVVTGDGDVLIEDVALMPLTGAFAISGVLGDGATRSSVYTATPDVELDLSGFNASKMSYVQEGADGSCDYASGVSDAVYAATASLRLTGADGQKNVCVQFANDNGDRTEDLRSSIVLDTQAPHDARVLVNGVTEATSSSTSVLLQLSAIDTVSGVATMGIDDGVDSKSNEPYATISEWNFAAGGERRAYINVTFVDAAGNAADSVSAAVDLDTVPPVAGATPITIDGGADVINTGDVTLTIDGGDASMMRVANDAVFSSALWQPVATTLDWTLSDGDGTQRVYIEFSDEADNRAGPYSDDIVVDTEPPILGAPAISIANGALYTSDPNVQVTLRHQNAERYQLSTDLGFSGAQEGSASGSPHTVIYPLPLVDGSHTLYVRYKDTAGNLSSVSSDAIVVDTTDPSLDNMSINGGAAYSDSAQVSISSFAFDLNGVSTAEIADNSGFVNSTSINYRQSLTYTIATTGAVTLYMRAIDPAGNVSEVQSASITVDLQAPVAGTDPITINSGDMYATDAELELTLEPGDADEMIVADNMQLFGGTWEAATDATTYKLNGPQGPRAVWVAFRDYAGNTTGPFSDSITLDTLAPRLGNPAIVLNGNARYTTTTTVTATLNAEQADSYQLATDLGFASATSGSYTGQNMTATFELDSNDGAQTVYVMYTDDAGNTSSVGSDVIVLDTQDPTLDLLEINNGASITSSNALLLKLLAFDASGVDRVEVATDAAFSAPTTHPFNQVLPYTVAVSGTVDVTLWARVVDAAGRYSAATSATITVDLEDPVAGTTPITINSGDIWATSTEAELTIDAGDADEMRISNGPNLQTASWQPVSTTVPWTLLAGQGLRDVHVQFRDLSGRTTPPYSDTIDLDTAPPTLGPNAIVIDSGALFAQQTTVSIDVAGNDATEVHVSQDAGFAMYTTAAYAGGTLTLGHQLDSSESLQTVYVRFKDEAGNLSAVGSDSITLDLTDPVLDLFEINNGASYSSSQNLSFRLLALDSNGVRLVEVADNAGFVGASNFTFNQVLPYMTTATTDVTLWVRVQDRAGRYSDALSSSITIDLVDPVAGSTPITINSGDVWATSPEVELAIQPGDADEMRISNGPNLSASAWQAVSTTVPWTLLAGQGLRDVHVQFRDLAGRMTPSFSDTIDLDTAAPTLGAPSITINGGANYTTSDAITVEVVGNGANVVEVSQDFGFATKVTSAYAGGALSLPFTLDSSDGTKTVYVRFVDAAGNVSAIGSDTVVLDTSVPVLDLLEINNGASTTASQTLTLTMLAQDTNGVAQVELAQGAGFVTSTTVPFNQVLTYNVTGDGDITVYARVIDAAGLVSAAKSATINVDLSAPSAGGTPIVINSGDAWTQSSNVDLTIDAADADEMRVVNGTNFGATAWQAVTEALSWTLVGGSGLREVSIELRDFAGNVTGPFSDTINVDLTAPELGAPAIVLNSGARYANSLTVTAEVIGTGATQVELSTDISFASSTAVAYAGGAQSYSVTLDANDGTQFVYVRFVDDAGNVSAIGSAQIILDREAPQLSLLDINNGATITNSRNLTLDVFATESNEFESVVLAEQADFSDAVTRTYAQRQNFQTAVMNGTATIYAKVIDKAGNPSAVTSESIDVDTTAPSATVTVAEGSLLRQRTVTLDFTPGAGSSDIVGVQFNETGVLDANGWQAYQGAHSMVLSDVQGDHTIYTWVRDAAGNSQATPSTVTVRLDTVAPTAISFDIAEGEFSNSVTLTVNFTYSGTDTVVEVGDDVGLLSPTTVTGVTTTPFTLSSSNQNDGDKTIYARFCDPAGNCSALQQKVVTLDRTPPTNISAVIEDGITHTATELVELVLNATGADDMKLGEAADLSDGVWEDYSFERDFSVSATEGTKYIRVLFRDEAGNVAGPVSATVVLDKTAPTGNVTISGSHGITASNTRDVDLQFSGYSTDVVEFMASNFATFAGATWQAITTSVDWTLSDGDSATKTVYAKFRDSAGNTSGGVVDTIRLDTTPPTNSYVIIDVDSGATNDSSINLILNADSATEMRGAESLLALSMASWKTYAASTNVNLTGADGTKFIFVQFRDDLGNETDAVFDTIEYDTTPPVGSAGSIVEGDYVNSLSVTLQLSVDAPAETTMIVSNDGIFNEAVQAFAPNATHLLESTEGSKTVNIKMFDTAGNSVVLATPAFTLDRTLPSTPTIQSSSQSIDADSFNLVLYADSVTDQNFSHFEVAGGSTYASGFTNVSTNIAQTTFAFGLQQDAENVLQIRAVDLAGNVSAASQLTIIEDSQEPAGVSTLTSTNGNNRVTLNWTPDENLDVVGYYVYYGRQSRVDPWSVVEDPYDGSFAAQGNSPIYIPGRQTNQMTLTDIGNGLLMYAAIKTVDASGNIGPFSNEVVGRPNEVTPDFIYPELSLNNLLLPMEAHVEPGLTSFFYLSSGNKMIPGYMFTTSASLYTETVHPTAGVIMGRSSYDSVNRYLYVLDAVPSDADMGMSFGVTVFYASGSTVDYRNRISLPGDEMAFDIEFYDDQLYVTRMDFGALLAGDNRLEVYELTDRETPAILEYATSTTTALIGNIEIATSHDRLYVSNLFGGVLQYDLAGTTPTALGEVEGEIERSIVIEGDYLYTGDYDELRVFDISTTTPTQVTTVATTEASTRDGLFIRASENRLYGVGYNGVAGFDISTPTAPTLVGEHTSAEEYRYAESGIIGSGDHAFVTDGFDLDLFDVFGATVQMRRRYQVTEQFFDLDVHDNLIVTAEGTDGIGIWDIASGQPVKIGSRYISSSYQIRDVKWVIEDGHRTVHAFAEPNDASGGSYGGYIIFNVDDPSNISYDFTLASSYVLAAAQGDSQHYLVYRSSSSYFKIRTYSTELNGDSESYVGQCNVLEADVVLPIRDLIYTESGLLLIGSNPSNPNEIKAQMYTPADTVGDCDKIGSGFTAWSEAETFEVVNQWLLSAEGNYDGSKLSWVDISDPGTSMPLRFPSGLESERNLAGALNFGADEQVGGVDTYGKYIYLFDDYGLSVLELDKQGNGALRLVGHGADAYGIARFDKPMALDVDGNFAWGITRRNGIVGWRIAKPGIVEQASQNITYPTSIQFDGLALKNDMLVAGTWDNVNGTQLSVFEADFDGQPLAHGQVAPGAGAINVLSSDAAAGFEQSVFIPTKDEKIVRVSLADPANPSSVASAASTDIRYTSSNTYSPVMEGNRIYSMRSTNVIEVWDASGTPTSLGTISTKESVTQLRAAGGWLFVAEGTYSPEITGTVTAWHLTGNSAAEWPAGPTYKFPGTEYATTLSVKGSRLLMVRTVNGFPLNGGEMWDLTTLWDGGVPTQLGTMPILIQGNYSQWHANYLFMSSQGRVYDAASLDDFRQLYTDPDMYYDNAFVVAGPHLFGNFEDSDDTLMRFALE